MENVQTVRGIVERIIITIAIGVQFALIAQTDALFHDEYAVVALFDAEQPAYESVPLSNVLARLTQHPAESRHGRFMPLVRPLQYIEYLAFDDNFVARHWFECFLWVLTGMMLYALGRRLSPSPGSGFMAGLFLAIAWPLGAMVVRVHRNEPVFLILQLLACILIWQAETMTHAPRTRRSWGVPLRVMAALTLVWISMFVKETSLPILPALALFGLLGIIFRPSYARRLYAAIFVGSMYIGIRMLLTIIGSRRATGYASEYEAFDVMNLLENVVYWRQVFLSGLGPLLILGVCLAIMRIVGELRGGGLSRKTLWRAFLLTQATAWFALHAPWPAITARYAFPGFAILGLLVACEIADLWRWSTLHRRRDGAAAGGVKAVWLLAACGVAWWLVPGVKVPIEWPEFGAKVIVSIVILAVAITIWRRRGESMRAQRDIDGDIARAARVLIVGGLVAFFVVSIPGRYFQIRQTMGITYGQNRSLFELVDEHALPEGRVVIAYDRDDWSRNFNGYRDRNFERRDYRYISQVTERRQLLPEDLLLVAQLYVDSPPDFPPPFDTGSREYIDTHVYIRSMNAHVFHPVRLPLVLAGLDSMSDIKEGMRWPTLMRELDFGWRIYLPDANAVSKEEGVGN